MQMIECSNLINVHNLSYLFFNIQREKKILYSMVRLV